MHATTVIKLGYREDLQRDDTVDLVLRALWEAADEDSATGGPDLIRGIFPVVATITADGFDRLADDELESRTSGLDHSTAVATTWEVSPMTMPFYVAPEQVMKDRADYARKGIARGRSLIGATFADGILLCAENPSRMLRKISEIYDRIAFAGVGKYNEFDQLRIAGVRSADLKGYSFSREDVDARSLANQYAQILGQIFTHEMKPLEVEILVAEVGRGARRTTSCSTSSTTARSSTSATSPILGWRGRGDPRADGARASTSTADLSASLQGGGGGVGGTRANARSAVRSRRRCWIAPTAGVASAG